MTDLTLPGAILGLLRRGSPIRLRSDTIGDLEGTVHQVYESAPGFAVVTFAASGQECALQGAAADAALDLTDATGRAHAAWWLDVTCDRHGTWYSAGRWPLRVELDGVRRWGMWTAEPDGYSCPALADLDPADPRLLPDGSRWVDAEALRRVVLRVAGVSRA